MDRVFDLLDIAAKSYPIKALAQEIDKAESTLRNELNQQEGYKLGLKTAVLIMKKTGDLKALDGIEAMFNRVAFNLPKPDGNVSDLMSMVADLTREFSEYMGAVAKALRNGPVTKTEARACLKELGELMSALIKLQAYLERIE